MPLQVALARRTVNRGERLRARGRLHAARSWFERATKLAGAVPDDPDRDARTVAVEAHVGRGRIDLALDAPDRAVGELEAAQRLEPDAWEPPYWDGCAHGRLNHHAAAVECFTRALALRPGDGRIRVQRAYAYAALGRHDAAWEDLLGAGGALDERARTVLAWLELRRRNWQAAEAALAGLPGDGHRDDHVTAMLAYALARQGKPQDAIKHYERLVRTSGAHDDRILYQHGLAAHQLGRFEASFQSWAELERRRGDHPDVATLVAVARAGRAARHAAEGRYDSAEQQLEDCRGSWPGDMASIDAARAELCLRSAAVILRTWKDDGYARVRDRLDAGRVLAPYDSRYVCYLALLDGLQGTPERGVRRIETAAAATAQDEQRLRWVRAGLDMLRGSWSTAADLLTALPDDDGWKADLLPECLYRAGRLDELRTLSVGGQPLRFWHALTRYHEGEDPTASLQRIADRDADSPSGRAATRALAHLRARAVLVEAAEGRWPAAAERAAEARSGQGSRITYPGIGDPVHEALVFLAADRRTDALRVLEDALRADPNDARVTHSLALMHLHELRATRHRDGSGGRVMGLLPWERCLAVWAALLDDDIYWERWRRQAARRYDTDVPNAAAAEARAEIEKLLLATLQAVGDPDLEPLLQRERPAARQLGALGGIPLDRGKPAVSMGPLLVRYLRLGRALGERAAKLIGDPEVDEDKATELIASFSQMGVVEASLDAGRPDKALAQLADLRCPRCRNQKATWPSIRPGTAARSPAVCLAVCPEFDERNPSYASLDSKRDLLLEDAALLAIEAHLASAKACITAAEMDPEAAEAHWLEAIGLAEEQGTAASVRDKINTTALGRADVLLGRRDTDAALALLERAADALDGSTSGPVERRLATLLNNRGVMATEETPPRWDDAARDLRRALDLHPSFAKAASNLSDVLRDDAIKRCGSGREWNVHRSREAVELLDEALEMLETCQAHLPGNADVQKALGNTTDALGLIYNNWAVTLLNDDNLFQAVGVLDEGLRRLPNDVRLRQTRKTARVLQRIRAAIDRGDMRRARRLLKRLEKMQEKQRRGGDGPRRRKR